MRTEAKDAEVGIYTFGKNQSSPPRPQYIIDVSGFRDPASNRGYKNKCDDGRNLEVIQYVAEDPRVDHVIDLIKFLTYMHLRSENGADGKWLSFGIQDHHGKWIAPAVGELVTRSLDLNQYKVYLYHAGV